MLSSHYGVLLSLQIAMPSASLEVAQICNEKMKRPSASMKPVAGAKKKNSQPWQAHG